jgi:HK97 family phage portal protein
VTWLGGLFERRTTLENPSYPLTSTALAGVLGAPPNVSGVSVSEKTAMRFSGVWRGVNIVAGVSAALPLHAYRSGTYERRSVQILDNPHPDLTDYEFWRLSYVHRCLWGNSYAIKVRNAATAIRELHPVEPGRVRVTKLKPTDANPSGKLFVVDGNLDEPLTSYDVLHVPGLGYDGTCGVSPIRLAATTVGMGLAAEEYGARLFGAGTLMSGVLQTDQRLTQEQADQVKANWRDKMSGLTNAHDIAVLGSGAKWQSVQMPNTDAQFIESRDFQISEVSRFLGVPPFLMMQTAKSTSWGTGLEQQAIGFVKFDLHPTWLRPTEARVTKELTGAGIYAKYKIEGLLRGDSTARAGFYNVMRQVGAMSANDIRELEDSAPIDGGDTYLQPMNMAPLGSEGTNDTTGASDAPSDG